MPEKFDAIVIGAGEASTMIASRAVAAGHEVAMIYRSPFGSTCLNTGCVPSKFIIHRARIAHLARTAGRFHVRINDPVVDLAAIVREKNDDIEHHRNESLGNARDAEGLTLIEGAAKFTSEREVVVAGRRLQADRCLAEFATDVAATDDKAGASGSRSAPSGSHFLGAALRPWSDL
jgi:pyruvate/2-oxoglutarate dehydrogenase complex dihydrolipoamide dehydrogenase (E3) component